LAAKAYYSTGFFSSVTGSSFIAVFTFPAIDLPEDAKYYELNYWVFMVCVNFDDCGVTSGDSITINVNDKQVAYYDYENIGVQRVWHQKKTIFESNEKQIIVNKYYLIFSYKSIKNIFKI
jgi:hypothetical protein